MKGIVEAVHRRTSHTLREDVLPNHWVEKDRRPVPLTQSVRRRPDT
jgi:hypothetical protein